ncbi:hypothetical protein JXA63_02905, partial [Candidatus Woesebacteria bacterium]|nr:hypothetical protein [Candidatus Woesebacteria bacterium]
SGAVELGSGDVSESGLLVDMEPSTIDVSDYDYDFFYNRAYDASNDTLTPSDVSTFDTSQLTSEGVDVTEAGNTYRVIVRNEETTINDGATVDIGDDKIILFVDNNLIIESAINLTKGQGFFMAIVSGNIIIDESVGDAYVPGNDDDTDPELEGIYVSTGGDINTGTYYDELTDTGADSDTTLEVRGVMAALTGRINMQRDLLDDSATPAEKFYYGPDQTLMVPQFFGQYVYRWKEVAP